MGTGLGFGSTTGPDDSEVYGALLYHNGWEGTDRGHGHGIDVANATGTQAVRESILFNSFGFGVHASTSQTGLRTLTVEGNVSFNHGVLSAQGGATANYLLGGRQVARNPVLRGNDGYYPAGSAGRNGDIGSPTPCANGVLEDNYFAGGTALNLHCSATQVTGNTFLGVVARSIKQTYRSNVYLTAPPATGVVRVRPNAYEVGRSTVVVYNWALLSEVRVDLSQTGLTVGDHYEVRDAQDFFGAPVVSGVYDGAPIRVPMTGLVVAPPVGNAPLLPAHTAPEFGAFVVLRVAPVAAAVTHDR